MVVAMMGGLSEIPVLKYPGTGITFTILAITMYFVERMDFMTVHDSSVGERRPLNTV